MIKKIKLLCFTVVMFFFTIVNTFSIQYLEYTYPGRTNPSPSVSPLTLYTCEQSEEYSIKIDNISPFTLTSVKFEIQLPKGIIYDGSFSGLVFLNGVSSTNIVSSTFPYDSIIEITIPQVFSQEIIELKLNLKADCGAYTNARGGNDFSVNVVSSFTDASSGLSYNRNKAFSEIIVKYPHVQLTYLNNNRLLATPYDINNPAIGDTIDRVIKIKNGGTALLTSLEITSTHSSCLDLKNYGYNGASLGVHSTVNLPGGLIEEVITLSSADIMNFGNGDGNFDPGETIDLEELAIVLCCNDPNTLYNVSWGCGTTVCQKQSEENRLVFPTSAPVLRATVVNNSNSIDLSCYGNGTPVSMELILENEGVNGIDSAKDVLVDIYQGRNSFSNNFSSVIDENSIQVIDAVTNVAIPFITENTFNNSALCNPNGVNSIGRFIIKISKIDSLQKVKVLWNAYTCCNTQTCYNSTLYFLTWGYSVTYFNRCGARFNEIRNKNGYQRTDLAHQPIAGNNVAYVIPSSGLTEFSFLIAESEFDIPKDQNTDYLKYKITIPPCMDFSGSLSDLFIEDYLGNFITPLASDLVISGNDITIKFKDDIYALEQARLIIKLTPNCLTCSPSNIDLIKIQAYYSPKASCGCEHVLGCSQIPIKIKCNTSCGGLETKVDEFNGMRRSTVGYKDADDNGIADLPLTKPVYNIALTLQDQQEKYNRASYGDTLDMHYYFAGGAFADIGSLPWDYLYFYSKIQNGDNFDLLTVDLTLLGSAGPPFYSPENYSLTNVPVVTSVSNNIAGSDSVEFIVGIDINALIADGTWPQKFNGGYADVKYRVNKNVGLGTLPCGFDFAFFPTTNTINSFSLNNPPSLYCDILSGKIDLIGYNFTSNESTSFDFHSCNQVELNERVRFNLGESDESTPAINYYSKEYRHLAYPDTLIIKTTNSYSLVSASIDYYRTAGTYNHSYSPAEDLTSYLFSQTLYEYKFVVGDLFTNGTFLLGDEGMMGDLKLVLEPNCNSLNKIDTITYDWKFKTPSILEGSNTLPKAIGTDKVQYQAPDIDLQTPKQTLRLEGTVAVWDVVISNNANESNAANLWFGFNNSLSTLNITNVQRVGGSPNFEPVGVPNNTVPFGSISQSNGLYKLYNVHGGNEIRVRITADIGSCDLDSIKFVLGWDCTGFPSNIASVTCPVKTLSLYAQPMLPNIFSTISTVSNSVDLCDEIEFTLKIENTDIGRGFNVIGNLFLQQFLDFIPGSASAFDPVTGSNYPITPSVQGSGLLVFDVSGAVPSVGSNGMAGLTNLTENYVTITFRAKTACKFTSGSRIEFYGEAIAACGKSNTSQSVFSNKLNINGATQTHKTQVILNAGFLSPCYDSTEVNMKVINFGPINSWVNDSITIVLPRGVHYASGSYNMINMASASAPNISSFGGRDYLRWNLLDLNANVDTSEFAIKIYSDPDSVFNCEAKYIFGYTTNEDDVMCTSTGNYCPVNIITGDTTEPIFTYKATLFLSNASAHSIPNPSEGEKVIVSFDISNVGQVIGGSVNGDPNPTVVSFYDDVDGSGGLSIADTLVAYDTILNTIPNGLFNYTDTVDIPAGKACNLLAVFDVLENTCICSSAEIMINNIELDYNEPDDFVCANIPEKIGYEDSINGYVYTWNFLIPGGTNTYLSSTTEASPTIVAPNPASGFDSLVYEIEINRNGCVVYDTIKVFVTQNPIADAGLNDSICENSYQLNGNIPLVIPGIVTTTGKWTIDTSFGNGISNNAVFFDSSVYNTNLSNLEEGEYKLIWTLDNGFCEGIPDTVLIKVNYTEVDAGRDTVLCDELSYTLNATSLYGMYTGKWKVISGQSFVTSPFIDNTSPNTVFTFDGDGIYELEWTVSHPNINCTFKDSVVIDLYKSIVANAGRDSAFCGVNTFNLWANNINLRNIGSWSVDSILGNFTDVVFADINDQNSSVTFNAAGIYKLVWSSENIICGINYDTIEIIITDPIVAFAGNDTSVCDVDSLTLNANSLGVFEQGKWESINGVVSFSDVNSPTSTVRGLQPGINTLVWIVNNNYCDSVTDTVEVMMSNSPFVYAGSDTSICISSNLNLYGNNPSVDEVGTWRQVDGNPVVGFAAINDSNSLVTGMQEGTYVFEWSITNNICDAVKDTVIVEVFKEPVANAGADINICELPQITLKADTSLSNLNDAYSWSFNSSISNYSSAPNILSANIDTSIVDNLAVGSYSFVLEVSNDYCPSSFDTVAVNVNANPIVGFYTLNDSICENECIKLFKIANVSDSTNSIISSLTWDLGDGNSSTFDEAVVCTYPAGSYDIKLTAITDKGCTFSNEKTDFVIVNPNPVPGFSYEPNSFIYPKTSVSINDLSIGATKYYYNYGNGSTSNSSDSIFNYSDTGKYFITQIVENAFGCKDSISLPINVVDVLTVFIPNSFTPNGDGSNDVFKPKVLGISPSSYKFNIFNRWGERIFTTTLETDGWDGVYKGKLVQDGVYVWKLQYSKKEDPRLIERTGTVVLFK